MPLQSTVEKFLSDSIKDKIGYKLNGSVHQDKPAYELAFTHSGNSVTREPVRDGSIKRCANCCHVYHNYCTRNKDIIVIITEMSICDKWVSFDKRRKW